MIRAALLSLIAFPAAAQSVTATDDAIILHNQQEAPTDEVMVFTMPIGDVTVRHITSPNALGGCCPDTLEVVDLPEGYVAMPHAIEVEEGDTRAIFIRQYSGM
ncbi:hypothetical protein ROJ8625_04113 [Roseivivax jejudonensis]|uniref:Uncharacterized protein n=1 Tax=Roseivivax jejudonensis TaxID=1529041 RepID=A0A1X7ABB6_9RHOB|nr:hypothetical protein [Roseivivax jejudonensis]SLN74854.1 hypothetical protein ROJ8625_04113 [Roseivivax jejudonensis]